MKKIKVGIVGTSAISEINIKNFQANSNCEIVGICDINEQQLQKIAERYDIKKTYTSYQEFLEAEIDAVYIAIPNLLHYEYSKKALLANKHVLCEKPITVSSDEFEELSNIAQSKNLCYQDALFTLYLPELKIIEKYLKEIGVLRKVILMLGKYSSRYDAYLAGNNPTTFRKELANGSIMDLGIYAIGISIYLFGEPINVLANSVKLENGIDALGSVILDYNSFEVTILHSKVTSTLINSEIQGESGTISINNLSFMKEIDIFDRNLKKEVIGASNDNEHLFVINDFIENIINKKTQSEILPHKTSFSIIKTLETIRNKAGIDFN